MRYLMIVGAAMALALATVGCKEQAEVEPAARQEPHEGHEHGAHEEHEEQGENEEHGESGHEGHDHGEHEGHDHPELPLDELEGQQCEHDMPTVECAECRYELGVVEVPAEVAARLLTEEVVRPALQTFRELNLRCETQTDEQKSVEVMAMLGGRVEGLSKTLGQSVKKGDVMAILASDEFSELKLDHEKYHQGLELAKTRFERLLRVQGNLEKLLERLRGVASEGVDVEAISKLEIGGAKAELMAAANAFLRARTDWQRDTQRIEDGRKLLARVKGEAEHDLDKLAVGKWKAEVLAARAELRLARKAIDRVEALGAKNLASRKEQDEARRDLSVASIQFDAAVEQVGLEIEAHEAAATEQLNTAQARLESAIEEAMLALEVERLEAQQELDRATTQVAVSHRRLELFGFGEDEIEQLADRGSDRFASLEIRAPAAGVIISQSMALGQIIKQGQPLMQIADLNSLWTWCHVYEKDLASLALGELPIPARVFTDAFPGQVFTGSLDYLDRVTDEHSRTVRARVVTRNPQGLLRPNMFVQATVDVPIADRGLLVVPSGAVVADAGKEFVFVHWRGNTWVKRSVEVARRDEASVYLSGGLSAGDKVAAKGAFFLKSDVLREKMGEGCAH